MIYKKIITIFLILIILLMISSVCAINNTYYSVANSESLGKKNPTIDNLEEKFKKLEHEEKYQENK